MKEDTCFLVGLHPSQFVSGAKMGACHISVKFWVPSQDVTNYAYPPMTQAALPPRPGPPKPISSPCVMVCTVDGKSGLCLGCYRSLQEIATWSRMTDEERAAIMADLSARTQRIDPSLL